MGIYNKRHNFAMIQSLIELFRTDKVSQWGRQEALTVMFLTEKGVVREIIQAHSSINDKIDCFCCGFYRESGIDTARTCMLPTDVINIINDYRLLVATSIYELWRDEGVLSLIRSTYDTSIPILIKSFKTAPDLEGKYRSLSALTHIGFHMDGKTFADSISTHNLLQDIIQCLESPLMRRITKRNERLLRAILWFAPSYSGCVDLFEIVAI